MRYIAALFAAGVFPLLGQSLFNGAEAFTLTGKAVAFGPRPDGSEAIGKLRVFIRQQLQGRGCEIERDSFTATTPDGPIPMENIICRFPGKSEKAIAITGHYDTKNLPAFVGANDGGSSTGFLLELANAVKKMPHKDTIYLVFFDGEEARHEWTETDSVYGSRHLAQKWGRDGTNAKLKALINVDMIGDKDIRLLWDTSSAASLRTMVWDIADSLGYTEYFPRQGGPIEDDHLPFLDAGVRALDLINFTSQNTFWHTPRDTMEKLSVRAFEVVGNVVMRTIGAIEEQQ
ncbi:MAG: M28 family peptidase [Acidobacteriota bacterium]|nr:M28 family peptidase [Acidobacteriota bacterium]